MLGSSATAVAAVALFVLHVANCNTATAAAPPPRPSCADEILMFSPCLSYVSSPPNDLDAIVTPKCCDVFSSILGNGSGLCLCYLYRDPAMLGFSLNRTRLLALSYACSVLQDTSFASNESLSSLCSASPPLPPLRDSAGSGIQTQPDSSPPSYSSTVSHAPELAQGLTAPSSSAPEAAEATDDESSMPQETPPETDTDSSRGSKNSAASRSPPGLVDLLWIIYGHP